MTEAQALANIVAWSEDIPDWQRDALRRLATGNPVVGAEVDELVLICKGQGAANPVTADNFRDPARVQGQVNLRRVHSVNHVNALAPDQRLAFQPSGLTIIYGDNGSGKSGYSRILKKACRARTPTRDDIIPNIYEADPGVPTATIDYTVGGAEHSCVWRLGAAGHAALTAVSVFDSRCANIHVEEANDLAYTPFPLKLLASLAQLCRSVKDKLAGEVATIKARTPQAISAPACNPTSAVGRLLAGLAPDTTPAAVEALATLSQAELDRLVQLTADLAGDPGRAARQLTTLKAKVDQQVVSLDRLFAAVALANAGTLRRLAEERDAALQAAAAASGALFRDEPLPAIGGDAWRALWESARAYSERNAYPYKAFPATEPGDVCVLCQQELTPEAASRLSRFEAFVRNDSQQRAEAARVAYEEALATFRGIAISASDARLIVATIRDELRQKAVAGDLRRSLIKARWRQRWIARHHADPSFTLEAPDPAYNRQAIVDLAAEIADRSAALVAEAGSTARAALLAEKTELADRHWLASIKEDVLAEIARRGEIAVLEVAQRATTTNRITAKSTEIAQALVTDALRAQFALEVASFGIAGLAVELRQQNSAQGIPRFKVALVGQPKAALGEVLSEGEHRCVGLAAFMAELTTAGNQSGIVFDDPVSSLDHMHRQAVARRLIDEASRRQVIVLTHDLAFLFELERAAQEVQPRAQVAMGSVARGADRAGFCRNEPPFKARRAAEVTGALNRQLANERRHFDHADEDSWRATVKSIAGVLRDTWETAVEETVGHVIRRLSQKVDTKGLIKLTVVTRADCEAMRDGYGRCSEMLHSAAPELNRPLPRPEALTAEIEALTQWATDLRQRQEAARLH
jgi:energy-coupling factor transporter ATP-binding protein EcfA2